jgi:hypothetical protein
VEGGRVLLNGNAAELADDERIRRAYLGESSTDAATGFQEPPRVQA